MAGVKAGRGPQGQLGLITHLRWRIFLNSLQTRRGKLELASRALVAASLGVMAVGVGMVLAVGGWATFRTDQPLILTAELWFVLVFWQVLPIFVVGFGAQTNLGSLLRFPVRFSSFYLLNLTYGLTDPVALAGTYWLLAILTGVVAAEPQGLAPALAAVLLFALFNVVLSRALMAWLERWLARRRTREILGLVFILFVLSLQLVGPISRHLANKAKPELRLVEQVAEASPPGLASDAMMLASSGQPRASLMLLGSLAGGIALLAWLLGVRLRAQYRGENLSEGRDAGAAGEREAVRPGWHLRGLSPAVSALFEKDLRYLLRNSSVYLMLVVPLLLVMVFGLSGGEELARRLAITGAGAAIFPAAVAYCMVIMFGLAYNSLGYEGAGITLLFAAPLRFRDVLFAKNLLHALVVLSEVAAVYVLVFFAFAPPQPLVSVLTLGGVLLSLPLNLAASNLTSLYFPRQLAFGSLRRQKAPAVAMLVAFGVQLVIALLAGVVYFAGYWARNFWYSAAGLLVLVLAAGFVYRKILDACSAIAFSRRETLLAELCRFKL